jgi:hypothetical protein
VLSRHHSLRIYTSRIGFPVVSGVNAGGLSSDRLALLLSLASYSSNLVALHINVYDLSSLGAMNIGIRECTSSTGRSLSVRSNTVLSHF